MNNRSKKSVFFVRIIFLLSICCFCYYLLLWIASDKKTPPLDFSFVWLVLSFIGICVFCISEKLKDTYLHIEKYLLLVFFVGIVIILVFLVVIIHGRSTMRQSNKPVYIILLGGGINRDGTLSIPSINRADAAVSYLQDNIKCSVIVTGGMIGADPFPEAYAIARYIIKMGIQENRVVIEGMARNTIENIIFSKEIIQKRNNTNIKMLPIAIMTSDFHIARSVYLARYFGLENITGIPVSPKVALYIPNDYLREIAAWIKLCLVLTLGKLQ